MGLSDVVVARELAALSFHPLDEIVHQLRAAMRSAGDSPLIERSSAKMAYCRYSIARKGANMLCKLQRIISVCGIALLALHAGGAGAQVRFIDAVRAQAADALAADDLQARKDKDS